jgi:hypothetical protein
MPIVVALYKVRSEGQKIAAEAPVARHLETIRLTAEMGKAHRIGPEPFLNI